METKICSKCGIEKLINKFHKTKNNKDGLAYYCKKCVSEISRNYNKNNAERKKKSEKQWRENNPEKVKAWRKKYYKENQEKILEYAKIYTKEYYKKNKERIKANNKLSGYRKKYYQINKVKIKKYSEKHKERRKKYIRIYQREKLRNDPVYRLNSHIRFAIWNSLKGNKNRHSWEKLVGYDCQELKEHLEKQFRDGMTWENYGKWHLDHILPISLFNVTGIKSKGFKRCWALENLQPMWAKENLSKSNKLFY